MRSSQFLENHTVKQFDDELDKIRNSLMEMGGEVEYQLKQTLSSLSLIDSKFAKDVLESETHISQLEVEIADVCMLVLAKHQPAAGDLRFVVGITTTVKDLEIIYQETMSIAQQAIVLVEQGSAELASTKIDEIAKIVLLNFDLTLDSFARLNIEEAHSIIRNLQFHFNERLDINDLIQPLGTNAENIDSSIRIMWVLKSLERIGTHVKNLCEQIVFIVDGKRF